MKAFFAGLLLLLIASSAMAQGLTIDQLGAGGALTGTEKIPMFQNSNPAVTTTPNDITTFTLGNPITIPLQWTGTFTVSGSNLTATGSPLYQNGGLNGTTGVAGVQALNLIQWNDNVNAGTNSLSYLFVHDHITGASFEGNRYAITGQIRLDATPNASDASIQNYVAIQANAIATKPTKTGLTGGATYAGYAGSLWGMDENVFLVNGATNWTYIAGHEIGVAIPTGASAADRWGLIIFSAGNLPGNIDDAAISIAGTTDTNALWKNGIEFGGIRHNWPIAATGCMICAVNRTQGGVTTLSATTGIDISAVTISGNAWSSPGYSVSGLGAITTSANNGLSSSSVLVSGTPFTGGTATTTFPLVYIATSGAAGPTTFSTNGTMFGMNAPLGFSGNFIDLHLDGAASIFRVDQFGDLVVGGTLTVGATNNIQFVGRGILTSPSGGRLQLGAADGAAPVAQTLSVQSVSTGNADTPGVNLTLIASRSTGAGTSGDIIFQTGGTGAGSTTVNAAVTALTIKGATQSIVLPAVTTGTPAASLCIDASNNIIKKTTAGSCI